MPRSGWPRGSRLLLFSAMVYPTVAAWVYFVALGPSPAARWVYLGAKAVQLALPLAWLALWGPGGAVPLDARRTSRGRLLGLATGFGMGAVLWAVFTAAVAGTPLAGAAAARIEVKLAAFAVDSPGPYLAMALALCVVHSLFEEFYWRWFVYGRLAARLPAAPATAVASAAFAAHHVIVLAKFVPPEALWTVALPGAAAVGLAGALWCWLYERTGSLTSPWLSHLVVDAAVMAIGWRLIFGT